MQHNASKMSSLDTDTERMAATAMASAEDFEAEEEMITEDDEMALLDEGRSSRRRDSSYSGLGKGNLASTWGQVKEIVIETVPTLLLTTVGLLFTGELLDHVSHWKAMRRIDELIIIIPVILNLKGNLEMNLSSRLGTAANIGDLDEKTTRYGILLGNIALLQVQATLVSFVAACLSFVLGLVMPRPGVSPTETITTETFSLLFSRRPHPSVLFDPRKPKSGVIEFIMVASTGMTSACLSSLILGSFMCTLVIACRRFSLNPDNIAPPIAACLGDLITLCLLGLVSTFLIGFVNTPLPLVFCIVLVISSLGCALYVRRNPYVQGLISQGWTPLFGAMVISTATGIILDLFVSRYSGFALMAVIISGLPGSVGAVAVSRISTALHSEATPIHHLQKHANAPEPSLRLVMVTLFLVTIPVEVVFLSVLHGIGWLKLPVAFIAASIFFFCITVVISLVIAKHLTNFLWKLKRDPDMYAMPIHSSVVDLIGQLLLVLCFELVAHLGGKVEIPGRHGR